MYATKTARNLRERIGRFSGDLSKGLKKPSQRFVAEMVYGIQAAQSVMLTEIGRCLEEPTALRKTEYRLSRNLQKPDLEATLQDNLLGMAAPHIGQDTLLVIDPSDIAKKYAKKMEYLATVRDGSAQDLGPGYWTLHVIGAEIGSESITPLYQRLWSAQAPDFVSENAEILRAVDAVRAHAGNRGIWVMDRGGDRDKLYFPLLEREARFLIRLRGDRHLEHNRQTVLANELAWQCPCRHRRTVTRVKNGKERTYELSFGYRCVRLPGRSTPLYLLVVHGFGQEPLMLLTTEHPRQGFKTQWRLVQAYIKRWSVEETIRYAKTCYDLENVRVLNYQGLQNLMPLVLAVMFFAARILDHDARLRIMANFVEQAAKRLFGIPDFKYYALSDGLRCMFQRHPGPPVTKIRPRGPDQLVLTL